MRLPVLSTIAALSASAPALAQEPHAGHQMPAPAAADPHAGHQMPMAGEAQDGIVVSDRRAGNREASGTSWQPDVTPHEAIHTQFGEWMVMTHATLDLVQDHQSGPRGGNRTFASGMLMSSASRPVGAAGALQLRAMVGPDPIMGPRGYPLLLASGETADGLTPLVDRQHPHELVMELSARYDHPLGPGKAFLYAGLPGEPAFGPPAFMHRLSIQDSPEAPISHHWLDSTHIVFGVVTAGYVVGDWKVEASRFRGREPDQHRWDIERPKLDSTALRLSWNPTAYLALQGSWADQRSPEQLEPDVDLKKWSASAIYTIPMDDGGWWSTTLAWGQRTATSGPALTALALESAIKPNRHWTVFARAERTENNELNGHGGPIYKVAKASIGAIRDFAVSEHVVVGIGGLYALNHTPKPLDAAYGGDPHGAMGFVRVKLR